MGKFSQEIISGILLNSEMFDAINNCTGSKFYVKQLFYFFCFQNSKSETSLTTIFRKLKSLNK